MQSQPLAHYVQEYDRLLEEFIDTFSDYEKREYNLPIAEGKWSPGQIVHHLTKSDQSILTLFSGATEALSDRSPDAKCADIGARFTETTVLLPAPSYVLPETVSNFSPEASLDAYIDLRSDVLSAVDFATDPTALVTTAAHPMFGQLTLTEWLYFVAIHGERHRRQVELSRR